VIKAVYYKPVVVVSRPDEVNEFFPVYRFLPATLGPGIYSDPNINDYQKQKYNVSVQQSAADA
jgi:hypothetical protein